MTRHGEHVNGRTGATGAHSARSIPRRLASLGGAGCAASCGPANGDGRGDERTPATGGYGVPDSRRADSGGWR